MDLPPSQGYIFGMSETILTLKRDLAACTICADRFAASATGHSPRPVVWFEQTARLLIAGQAPGIRVHEAGIPFHDRSGDRLRDWLGIDSETFYDTSRVAIVPMAFCFPGYSKGGSDLPPPSICAQTWRDPVMTHLPEVRLTLVIGGYAQRWHLGKAHAPNVTTTVRNWQSAKPGVIPLPHPSWRNTAWLKANPWFETDLLPVLRSRVQKALQ